MYHDLYHAFLYLHIGSICIRLIYKSTCRFFQLSPYPTDTPELHIEAVPYTVRYVKGSNEVVSSQFWFNDQRSEVVVGAQSDQ